MRKTIFDKIVIGFVVLMIGIFTALTLFNINITQQALQENAMESLTSETQMLASSTVTEYVIGKLTFTEMTSQLDSASSLLNCEIWLADASGKLLYSSNDISTETFSLSSYISDLSLSFTNTGKLNGYFSTKHITVGIPITTGDTLVCYLVLHTSLSYLSEITEQTLSYTYMPFLVVIILSLVALMLITNSTLRPIREIIATSKQYAAGNFNARVNVHTGNEFDDLARYMEEMADELARSDEYRKSFISNVSHDFRSPLTSIKGYIEAMIDGTIPPELHEKYLQVVLSETNRLTKLTQGLIELKDFDSFSLQLDKSNFNIKEIIQPTINTFERRCMDKGVHLNSYFYTERTTVLADRTRIHHVIYNLVDNAIKFTDSSGHVSVHVMEKNDKLVVSVRDEGVGISPEAQKKIFDRFYKTDPSRGKDKTGSGIGLAITKEVIKAHGEHITVTSTEGKGSEFTFSLPFEKEMQASVKPVKTNKSAPAETVALPSNGKFKIKS